MDPCVKNAPAVPTVNNIKGEEPEKSVKMSTNSEIELLERVLLRLGCAETDEQLEVAVNKFLGPVLLKIDSPNENVRKRVLEILTHINKRLKSRPLVKVPLETVLELYQGSSSSFLNNFGIIYIIMGFPRVDHDKQVELTPKLLSCLEGKPEPHQDKILLLILPLLGVLKIPGERVQEVLGLSDRPSTKKQLLSLLQDILLLPYGITSESEIPPGFSPYSFKRALTDGVKASEDLEALKKGIVKFINLGAFTDEEVLPLLVVGTADTRFSVATPALQELNKICTSLDWSKASLSASLYTLFTGNGAKLPDRKTTPTNARHRQKIFQYLLKCRGAGVNTAKGIQIIFESLFGENTNQKCKVLALQFADVVVVHSERDLMNKVGPVILTGISKLIGPESTEPSDVQNAAYNALARLITVCPGTVNKDVKIVVNYFNYLSEAPSELHTSIREALVALAQAFTWKLQAMDHDGYRFTPNTNQNLLIGLLAEKSESKSTIVQNVASIYLTTCFPDYYVPARYLLLLIAGTSPSLKEMVTTYLFGNSKKDNINYNYISSVDSGVGDEKQMNLLTAEQRYIILPGFKDMANYVYEQAEKKASAKTSKNTGKMHLAFTYDVYTEILDYLRLCFWFSSGITEYPDEDTRNLKLGMYIRTLATDEDKFQCIKRYNELIKCMVVSRKGLTELSCLLDLVSATPEVVAEHNLDLLEPLDGSLKEISENSRTLIAKIYGTLLAFGANDEEIFVKKVRGLLSIVSKSLEHQHGSVLAVSHALHRKIIRLSKENRLRFDALREWGPFEETVTLLVNLMTSTYHLLMKASIEGIGLIGSVANLPLVDDKPEAMEVDGAIVQYTKKYVLDLLFKHLKSAHSRGQISEEAALCLGHLTNGDPMYFTKRVLQGFINLIKLTKNPSIHIAIAQAFVCTVQGTTMVQENDGHKGGCSDEDFNWLLDQIINVVSEPYPNSRQACALWLLALVKNCSDREPILKRRHVLQAAFTELLSEDSELVQDVSSRGLGIVYSLCDSNTQEELSNMLLEQLTGGRRQALKVNEDSKVFEEGALGKAPTGGNLSTYKELCALASDLNQPEMIYQFMQLANHNAVWQSKLGAAFGIKSISKVAKVKMQPYLGKIVPRLFRYKYDPTPKIQNSMISIWDSVVVDSKATVELYYWDILADVSSNLTSSEWRTRIACALAARDLIKRPQGLKLRCDVSSGKEAVAMDTDQVPEPELENLWRQLFRVMDDYHEGTRLAAEGTVNVLSKVCVMAASSDYGKAGSNVASSILPLLLDEGVVNTVAEIRKISIKTVSELIDSSRDLIKPHLPSLIPCLLKATGELDSVKLSHLSNMVSSQQGAQEAVDSIRAEAAKSHHTMDALAKCIRFLDYPALEQTTPAVLEIMKTSVNLGTKIACAHFICLITVQIGKEMTPISGKYITACLNGLNDRNATVKKYFSSAIGHLVGCAKEQSIVRLFDKLTEAYFDPESTKARAIPTTIQAIHKRHQDLLKDYAPNIIPLIFFAMHEAVTEENRHTVEQWKDIWHEISAGDIGIKLNLQSIVKRLEKCFESPSWALKAQSANAINTVAKKMDSNLTEEDRKELMSMLLANVLGRTYSGKEKILEALASLSKHLKKDGTDIHFKLIDAVMRECRKEEPIYKTFALRATGDILDHLQEDRFEDLYNMVAFLLDKTDLAFGDDDGKSLTAAEKSKSMAVLINLKEAVCEALGKAWPSNAVETQQKYQLSFVRKTVECLPLNTRPVQVSLIVALGKFLEKLSVLNPPPGSQEKKQKIDDSELNEIITTVLSAVTIVSEISHTGLRKEALNIILILIKKLQTLKDEQRLGLVKTSYEGILTNFQKDNSPEIKCRLKEIEEKLKA